MTKIAQGVRVLEVAMWTYVPVAGAILAEWGADVIKVEHPEAGDPQRGLVTSGMVPSGPGGINHMIELPNRGKRSIGLDLSTEEGHRVLLELAATADVFLTNFTPPARAKLRIEVDDIRAANPNIIYVRGSGVGQRGPERNRGAYDASAFWARSVAQLATPDDRDFPVVQPGPAYGDLIGGMTIAGGIVGALFHRERTGEATVVDNSLLHTGMWATGASILGTDLFGPKPFANPRDQAPNPVVNTYKTADGRFVTLVFLQSDRYWAEFVTNSGRPDLVDDPRFADAAARYQHRTECVHELDGLFASKTLAEWTEILDRGEGIWSPVLGPEDLLVDEQVAANGYLREVTVASGSTYRVVAAPLQFNEEPPDLAPAPDHGEHTDELLAELGYDTEAQINLKISGAVL
jgi:crotonobetainyl-CoA:carnitine CoA-transferase CaiB-like acyl-CoA transferase